MKLRLPKAIVYTSAIRPAFITPNVYYGTELIGVGIRLRGRRVLSIVWGRPSTPDSYEDLIATRKETKQTNG